MAERMVTKPRAARGGHDDRTDDRMAFLRPSLSIDPDADIRGARVYLRYPAMQDYAAWAELRALSRQHLTPWEPQWARDELTRSSFRRRLRRPSARRATTWATPT